PAACSSSGSTPRAPTTSRASARTRSSCSSAPAACARRLPPRPRRTWGSSLSRTSLAASRPGRRPADRSSPATSRRRTKEKSSRCHPGIRKANIRDPAGYRPCSRVPSLRASRPGRDDGWNGSAMPKIVSSISTSSDEFKINAAAMRALVADLTAKRKEAASGGPERLKERHLARGKLLPRDRVLRLIDPGSPFLELSPLAALDLYTKDIHAAGVITGVGRISGRECVIVCNDATIKGGTYYPMTVKKHLRAQEVARENRLPCIYLVDSGGANLPQHTEVFPDREHFGRIFYNQATLSSLGIPQIACVMGSCTAGGAYVPAMSDESVIVRRQGTIFLGGPPLVKAATGETVSAEELGGAEVHTRQSGVADHYAMNDEHALEIVRAIVANLNTVKKVDIAVREPRPPAYDPAELDGVVPASLMTQYDTREV